MKKSIALSCILAAYSIQASPLGIVGGEGDSIGYAAQVSTSGVLEPPVSPLPEGPAADINVVSINRFGTALIGGTDGTNKLYAAFVSASGVVTPISNLAPDIGNDIVTVSINSSGTGIVGGILGSASYAAYISSDGVATQLSPTPMGTAISSVSINDSGFAIIGGGSGTPFAAFVSPTQVVTPLTVSGGGTIQSVAINSSGNAIIGGEVSSDFYAAFVTSAEQVIPLSLPMMGEQSISVGMNDSGDALVAGTLAGAIPYAAFFSFPSTTPKVVITTFPSGVIRSAAINSSGTAIIGGLDFAGTKPYAALVSPDGVATPLSPLFDQGSISTVAINSFGTALIGGFDFATGNYLALVTPSGRVISLVNTTVLDLASINSVAILDAIPMFDSSQSLTGNNAAFANYINNFAPEKAFYFAPAFYDGTLVEALESAAPTRNAVSLYTASNNLFYLTTTLATHLRAQHLMGQKEQTALAAHDLESNDSLLASLRLQKCRESEEKSRPFTVWFDAIGALAYQKAQSQTPAFNPVTGGAIFSFDAKIAEKVRVGTSLAYLFTHVHEKKGAGYSDINQEDLFLYASWEGSHFYADGAIGGGLFQTHQVRNIEMSGFHFKSSSNPDGWQLIPHFEFGYNGHLSKGATRASYNPFIMLDWGNAWQSGYHEKGSGPFNAAQKHHYSSLLRTEVGLRLFETFLFDSWNLVLEEKASYVNTESFHTGRVHAFLIGSPGAFTVTTLNSSQNLGVAQFAMTFDPLNSAYPITTLFYQGEFSPMYKSHELNLELSWNF